MNRKKKHKPKPISKSQIAAQTFLEAAEKRTAIASNVAWMLSLLSTITAEVIGLVCRWYTVLIEPVELLTVLSGVMLFVALISGITTLALIPVVIKFNKTRPPSSIIQIAVLAGSLPIVAIALQYFMRI